MDSSWSTIRRRPPAMTRIGPKVTMTERPSFRDFNVEDRTIARLFREVVDAIMVGHGLRESHVDAAIANMKKCDIHVGHKTSFRRFGLDFRKASYRCGYLRRYAVCHTGLVKRAVWGFFTKRPDVLQGMATRETVRVVSLGGGPGSDLIGFCCALGESTGRSDVMAELDLKIADISQGWVEVFPTILRAASQSDFGSLSKLMKKAKITTSFLNADLDSEAGYQDTTLGSVLESADIVLMVKVLSFVKDQVAATIVQKVVDSMHPGSLLVFIDQPYLPGIFQQTSSLRRIYFYCHKYELSFKPSKYHCPAIDSCQGSIAVFEKG